MSRYTTTLWSGKDQFNIDVEGPTSLKTARMLSRIIRLLRTTKPKLKREE